MLKSWKVLKGGGLRCHLHLRHLVDIYQVIQILKSNGEGARGSEWCSCGTDVTGPPFGGYVDLLIVVVETRKVCLMNNSETTDRTQLTRDTKVMWTSDVSLHRLPFRMFHRTSHIFSHVKWNYTLLTIASVCDSPYVLTACEREMPIEESATQFSWLTTKRGDSRAVMSSNQHVSISSFSLTQLHIYYGLAACFGPCWCSNTDRIL